VKFSIAATNAAHSDRRLRDFALPKSLAFFDPSPTLSSAEGDAGNVFRMNWSALADDFRTFLSDAHSFELAPSAV
jgi:hypothetical protein